MNIGKSQSLVDRGSHGRRGSASAHSVSKGNVLRAGRCLSTDIGVGVGDGTGLRRAGSASSERRTSDGRGRDSQR